MTRKGPQPPATLLHSRTTVYADFTSAECYLASVRTDRLIEAGNRAPDWRAVEHRPRLPLSGVRLNGAAHAIRGKELATARQLLEPGEVFEARNPGFLPNTRAAIAAYAAAHVVGIADLARRLLFDAYWVRGADIGDPEVLRRLLATEVERARTSTDPLLHSGYVVTSELSPVRDIAHLRIRDWQQAWLSLGTPVELTVVDPHTTECGSSALQRFTRPPELAS